MSFHPKYIITNEINEDNFYHIANISNQNIGIKADKSNIEISSFMDDKKMWYYRLNKINHGRIRLGYDKDNKKTMWESSLSNDKGSGEIFKGISNSYNLYIRESGNIIDELWVISNRKKIYDNNIGKTVKIQRQMTIRTKNGKLSEANSHSWLDTLDTSVENYNIEKDFSYKGDDINYINKRMILSHYLFNNENIFLDIFGTKDIVNILEKFKNIDEHLCILQSYHI